MNFEPIAIVGRACILPGAPDIATLSSNLRAGRDFVTPAPDGRWRLDDRFALGESGRDCAWSSHGGYVTGFDRVFDAGRYAVSPEIMDDLDPAFQWSVYVAAEAMHDAGVEADKDVAVVLGNLSFPSEGMTELGERIWLEHNRRALGGELDALGVRHRHPWNRYSSGLPAHVVSLALGLGDAYALDAACASSLYALHLAADKLVRGEARVVLAGAVNRADSLFLHIGFCALNALSPSGRSRPFHEHADGLIPAEGAACVALKLLRDAERDGDKIHGVIRGVGLSNDGRGRGFLAPSQDGQERAIRAAYAACDVDPAAVDYVECHATGTSLGDATELGSMQRIWTDGLMVGSHKSNFGHAITVAGMSGLLKVLDALEHGEIAPTLHCDEPIELARGAFDLVDDNRSWDGRFAGVNAFGFGGNNAHVIVERPGYEPGPIAAPPAPEPIAIVATWMRIGDLEGSDQVFDAYLRGTPIDPKMSEIAVELDGLRFPPRDLGQTLGQQLVMLEGARRATEDGALEGAAPDRISVLVGMGVDPEIVRYGARWRMAQWGEQLGFDVDWVEGARDLFADELRAEGVVGSMPNIPANRVNSQLDVRGPSFTVSSEQASGLRALQIARAWLGSGKIDAAIVGAAELGCELVHETIAGELAHDQPPADAAVVLVVRRLSDARAQGLNVLAVLDDGAPEPWTFDSARARAAFGYPHAAQGLLDVALTAHCCGHAVQPGSRNAAPWLVDRGEARQGVVKTRTIGAQHVSLGLRSDGSARPLPRARKPHLAFAHGADRTAVIANLRAGVFVDRPTQSARVAVVATPTQLAAHAAATADALQTGRTFGDDFFYREGTLDGEVAFVFTGSATAYPGMGGDLIAHAPQLVEGHAGPAPAWLYDGSAADGDVAREIWATSWLSQVHAHLSTDVLGLSPDAAIGYSLGESSALFALGAWGDFDELLQQLPASKLFQNELAGDFAAIRAAWVADGHIDAATGQSKIWENWTILGDVDKVRTLAQNEPLCEVTIVNADDECVLGGSPDAIERVLLKLLDDPKVQATQLPQSVAVHTTHAASVRDAYRTLHLRDTQAVEGVRFYSNATNTHYAPTSEACADAIVGQAVAPIDFAATVRNAWADGVRIFIEHGPRAACTSWISRVLHDREHLAVALDRAGTSAAQHVLGVAAQLVLAGVDVDWRAFADLHAEPRVRPMSKSLKFPAHAPPVELRRGDVFVMPAPPRPFAGASGVDVAQPRSVQPPQPVSLPAPSPVPAQPVTFAGPLGSALDFQRQVSEVHTAFMEQQAAVHHQFIAYQQASVHQLAEAYRHATASPLLFRGGVPEQSEGGVVLFRGGVPEQSEGGVVPAGAKHDARATSFTLSREDLEFLSHGPISKVFGPQFEPQDQYDVVVRMPMPPLLLADRVTEIDAEPASMKAGRIVTETDVREDSWWLYNGHMPAGIMIESGQADLLLVSYLGVDLLNKGERVYRLLGCKLTYRGDLPKVGDTLCYDIEIDGFAKHGEVRLFFFHYDCTVGDGVRLQVRHGQAGFFTYDELEESGGILWKAETGEYDAGSRLDEPAVRCEKSSLGYDELAAFSEGRPWDCFGAGWELTKSHLRTPCISDGDMLFLDRVTDLDYRGGPWKRGYLRAEADVTPDDWFFEGHFHNDPCMPGTLMFEGALQAMTIYLAASGVTIDRDAWRFQPVRDVEYDMRCRGQVDPESKLCVYEIFVESFDDGSQDGIPKLFADMLVTVDGLGAFHCRGMGLELVPDYPQPKLAQPLTPGNTPLANEDQVRAIQLGRPSDAFGDMYAAYDGVRNVPRLPNPPYDLVTRVASATGHMSMETGAEIVAEYDVAPDAWYFDEGNGEMPYGVLLEAGLQPCGWLASWVGCAATSPTDVFFRNLDGTGTLHRPVTSGDRMLTTTAKLTKISRSGPMTIVGFDVDTRSGDEPIYTMETVFGFFPAEALVSQAGISDAPDLARADSSTSIDAIGRLGLLTRVTHRSEDRGIHGAGRVVAEMDVDPGAWFFKAHFFGDPVQPGSLGLQLMLDALSLLGDTRTPAGSISAGNAHTWKYRGQVRPWKKQVVVDVHRRPDGLADAWLWTDGECIYRFEAFGVGSI